MTNYPIVHFTGQSTFLNRGCEAIIRGTLEAFNQLSAPYLFNVPSNTPTYDAYILQSLPQCKMIEYHGPFSLTILQKISRYTNADPHSLLRYIRPPKVIRESISAARYVFSVGGDNYSLDYGYPLGVMATDKYAIHLGKPTILWGASVGPFSDSSVSTSEIIGHLSKFEAIFLREDLSYAYLHDLGLQNIHRMPDPGFFMTQGRVPQELSFITEGKWIGLNLSLLVFKGSLAGWKEELKHYISWISWVEKELGLRVLLIPHVVPQKWGFRNNDMFVLNHIYKIAVENGLSPILISGRYSAPEYKAIIACCKAFIGARTHSTIAAWSSGVPCGAISYSIKARGLCYDLFGNEQFVIKKDSVNAETLIQITRGLLENRDEIRKHLHERVNTYRSMMVNVVNSIFQF